MVAICVVCLLLLYLLYPFSQHWFVSKNHYTVLSIYKKPTLGISLWGFLHCIHDFMKHCIHDFMKMSMRSHALHQGSASWLPQVRYCIGVSFSIRIMPAPLSIEESRYGAKKSWLTQFDTTCSVHLGIFTHQAEKWQEIRPTAINCGHAMSSLSRPSISSQHWNTASTSCGRRFEMFHIFRRHLNIFWIKCI